jgi:hypothetical protein
MDNRRLRERSDKGRRLLALADERGQPLMAREREMEESERLLRYRRCPSKSGGAEPTPFNRQPPFRTSERSRGLSSAGCLPIRMNE